MKEVFFIRSSDYSCWLTSISEQGSTTWGNSNVSAKQYETYGLALADIPKCGNGYYQIDKIFIVEK